MKGKATAIKASQTPAPKEAPEISGKRVSGAKILQTLLIPILAVFTGLVFGAVVIVVSDATVIVAYRDFFHAPGAALLATWNAIASAYGGFDPGYKSRIF